MSRPDEVCVLPRGHSEAHRSANKVIALMMALTDRGDRYSHMSFRHTQVGARDHPGQPDALVWDDYVRAVRRDSLSERSLSNQLFEKRAAR